jgi:argininosuccinate lyase
MAACADANFLTVTELADTLVRSTGMSFHIAHEIVSKAVKEMQGKFDADKMIAFVRQILVQQYPHLPTPAAGLLERALQAANFVAVRKIDGGPAPEVLEPEIERARQQLVSDQQKLQAHLDRFRSARERLREAARLLLASSGA